MSTSAKMRLNRYIARSGASSRREADLLIQSGRVTLNGEVCRELATSIRPGIDIVRLDGARLDPLPLLYYKHYKPRGVVTTLDDPQGRDSLADFMEANDIPEGVVPAGRLDRDSEGLLLLTSDGDMLQRVTHPSHGIEKFYRTLLERRPMEDDLRKLRKGVKCKDYVARALRVTRMGPQPPDEENPTCGYWLEIVMGEGRKREIRAMMAAIGHRILRLVRIAHGPIVAGDLKPGEIRRLEETEVESLVEATRADVDRRQEPVVEGK